MEMGMQASDMCPAAKRLQIASLVFGIVGSILTWAGVGLPFWYIKGNTHSGVFQTCEKTFDNCNTTNDGDSDYRAVPFSTLLWGLAIGGSILLLIGLFFLIMYPIRKTVDHCKITLAIFASIFLIAGVIAIASCLVIYVDWFHRYDARYRLSDWDIWEDLGFAWYITLGGVILVLISVICLGLSAFFMLYYSEETTSVRAYRGKFNYH